MPIFRNARFYEFTEAFTLPVEALHRRLEEYGFTPCAALQEESSGWVDPNDPLGTDSAPPAEGTAQDTSPQGATDALPILMCQVGDALLLSQRRQKRILPAGALKEALAAESARYRQRTGTAPSRRELRELKDRLRTELLPRTLTQSQWRLVIIDPVDGWLAIDSSNQNQADKTLDDLREALGSLTIEPLSFETPPSALASKLLLGERVDQFTIGQQCQLQDPLHEKSVINYRNIDLDDAALRSQLKAGLKAANLELVWRDQLSLVVASDGALSRIRFLDTDDALESEDRRQAQSSEHPEEVDGPAQSQDLSSDLALYHLTFRALLADLQHATRK